MTCRKNEEFCDCGSCIDECYRSQDVRPPDPTSEEMCAAFGHREFGYGGRCYCGSVRYLNGLQRAIERATVAVSNECDNEFDKQK